MSIPTELLCILNAYAFESVISSRCQLVPTKRSCVGHEIFNDATLAKDIQPVYTVYTTSRQRLHQFCHRHIKCHCNHHLFHIVNSSITRVTTLIVSQRNE